MPHVGILNYAGRRRHPRAPVPGSNRRHSGYVEGRNLTLTLRSADGVFDRLPGLAAELVAAKVDVIIALGPATWAARHATTSIPIIVAFSGDRWRWASSRASPGPAATSRASPTCRATSRRSGSSS